MSQPSGWTPRPASIRPFSPAMYTPGNPQGSQRTMRIGFTAAGICLIAGALILTFVAMIAQPLLSSNSSSPQPRHTNTQTTPPATVDPSTTVPTPTPPRIVPHAHDITN